MDKYLKAILETEKMRWVMLAPYLFFT